MHNITITVSADGRKCHLKPESGHMLQRGVCPNLYSEADGVKNTQGCRAQVVFDVDPKLAAELADAKFAFVTRPTSEGEQDVVDDETPTDNTNTGDNNGGGSEGGNGGLE
jgi:hypothetical protein